MRWGIRLGMSHKNLWIGTSWKMNKLRADALAFATALREAGVARFTGIQPFVIPPLPYLAEVAKSLANSGITVGAQNMHWAESGAWTGEVSAPMLADCGATLVELGHSERRTHFGETDETVGKKVASAIKHGLTPLVCIGDTRSEYEAGTTSATLARQVHYALHAVNRMDARKVMFAYEPVWSIGEGGVPADPDFANDQHRKLKELTTALTGEPLPILYGGSVNPGNCVSLAARSHIDGLFIGRSAWEPKGFIGILDAVHASRR
jgi:L-erythrulose 1-phosphate isomerase